uniref:Uncharacterized protein n=1 Tax=Anopheles culicifacies TaxID=139723 RepID=A0A182MEF1_9DIPT
MYDIFRSLITVAPKAGSRTGPDLASPLWLACTVDGNQKANRTHVVAPRKSVSLILTEHYGPILHQHLRFFGRPHRAKFRTRWNQGLRQILQTGIILRTSSMSNGSGISRHHRKPLPIDGGLHGGSVAASIGTPHGTVRRIHECTCQQKHVHRDGDDGQRDDTG